SNSQAQCSFTHRRSSCNDDEVRFLKARCLCVEFAKARCKAGQSVRFTVSKVRYLLQHVTSDRLDVKKTFACAFLGQREYHLFGTVENYFGIVLFGKRFARDLIARSYKSANNRLVLDDFYVFLEVRKMW